MPASNQTKTLNCPIKPKGVTMTQMKSLKDYFVIVVFTFLLDTVCVFANFVRFEEKIIAVKWLINESDTPNLYKQNLCVRTCGLY